MTTTPRPAGPTAVIANPASGSAGGAEELRAAVGSHGVEVRWLPTTEDDPGSGQAARAIADRAATVVAAGGDGTVRAVLESLAGTDVALGIVPLGTGNLLAGNLGLPDEQAEAVAIAVGGDVRRLDLACVNGEHFAVMSGVGFDARMIGDANPTLKRRLGSVAYVLSAIRNLRSDLFGATLRVDGTTCWQGRTPMVLIGNCGRVSGGLEVFPDAAPDDGILDVAVLAARRPGQWASVLWRMVRGRPQRPELVRRERGHHIVVDLSRPLAYELDGEVRDPVARLEIRIEPAALVVRVAAPS